MIGLTPRQRELYTLIVRHVRETGNMPSYREMAKAMGGREYSTGNIHRMVTALIERGLLTRLPNRARAIRLVDEGTVTLNPEILALVDKYSAQDGLSRDAFTNAAMRDWFESCTRSAA